MSEQNEKFNKELETLKKIPELLKFKTTTTAPNSRGHQKQIR